MFQRLQHEDARAFTQHQPAPLLRKWPAGVVRQDPHGLPRLDNPQGDTGLAAARKRNIRLARAQQHAGLGQRMVGRGAGTGDRERGPTQAKLQADLRRGGAEHRPHDAEWMHPRLALAIQTAGRLVMRGLAARTGAHHDGGSFGQCLVAEVQPGLRHGFTRGNQGVLGHRVQQRQALFVEIRSRLETLDFSRDGHAGIRGRDTRDRRYAGPTFPHGSPGRCAGQPQGADTALAGDDDCNHEILTPPPLSRLPAVPPRRSVAARSRSRAGPALRVPRCRTCLLWQK